MRLLNACIRASAGEMLSVAIVEGVGEIDRLNWALGSRVAMGVG